jgi:hypothetical protein
MTFPANGQSEVEVQTPAIETPAPETVTPAEGTPPVETPAAGGEQALDGTTPLAEAAPAYTPDFKFRYRTIDKEGERQAETEIPELYRGLIKDADTEKQVKELFQKAHGLDFLKQDRDVMRTERDEFKTQFNQVMADVAELGDHYKRDDLDAFFQKLKVPPEKVLQWAVNKAKLMQMTPEQQQAHEGRIQAERNAYYTRRQNEMMSSEQQSERASQRELVLDMGLRQPDVRQIADQYDAQAQQPGAFRQLVIERGILAWHNRQVDLTPDQALAEAMQIAGKLSVKPGLPGTTSVQPGGAAPAVAPAKKPVIPNVGGSPATPVRKSFKSLDEIREHAKKISTG